MVHYKTMLHDGTFPKGTRYVTQRYITERYLKKTVQRYKTVQLLNSTLSKNGICYKTVGYKTIGYKTLQFYKTYTDIMVCYVTVHHSYINPWIGWASWSVTGGVLFVVTDHIQGHVRLAYMSNQSMG
jgi:hypothetical protein